MQLPNKKPSISGTKEEDKFQQEVIIEKGEYRPRQPIILRSAKLKFKHRWLKTKWSSLWVIKAKFHILLFMNI